MVGVRNRIAREQLHDLAQVAARQGTKECARSTGPLGRRPRESADSNDDSNDPLLAVPTPFPPSAAAQR